MPSYSKARLDGGLSTGRQSGSSVGIGCAKKLGQPLPPVIVFKTPRSGTLSVVLPGQQVYSFYQPTSCGMLPEDCYELHEKGKEEGTNQGRTTKGRVEPAGRDACPFQIVHPVGLRN